MSDKQKALQERMREENEKKNSFNKHPCYQLSQESLKCSMKKGVDCTDIQNKWKDCMKNLVRFVVFYYYYYLLLFFF